MGIFFFFFAFQFECSSHFASKKSIIASHNPKNDTLVGECIAEEELMTDAHVMDHVLQTAVQNSVMKISQLLLMVEWNRSLGYLRGFFGFRDSLGFCA
jgi:hypothetical protein